VTNGNHDSTVNVAPQPRTFIDLFAGCGGLSLGLMQAGWQGLFAVERSPDAFKTLSHNLISDNPGRPFCNGFAWPSWLPKEPIEIGNFLSEHSKELSGLRGTVTLVAGGPPCQGFSFAGRRQANDPRNQLFKKHLDLVDILKPKIVFLENVQGISIAHGKKQWLESGRRGRPRKSYAEKIKHLLDQHGYEPQQVLVRACDFGVPQYRPRYLTVGIRRDLLAGRQAPNFLETLMTVRDGFLKARGLPLDGYVNVAQAISDLCVTGKTQVVCNDPESPNGFLQISYVAPESDYQRLMHGSLNGHPINSLRLPKHRPSTVKKFKRILATCRKGVQLSDADRKRLDINKTAIVPLAPDQPSHTLTTLPDDLLHYNEPRIHTVREHARLQSFPDWFDFRGKFTTGGDRRTRECPRYTQVGNAVPPLLAEAIGQAILKMIEDLHIAPSNG